MESFFSRYKNALVLMLAVLAQVVLLAMQVRRPAPDMPDGHNVRLWRSLVAGVVTPPERLIHGVGLSVRGVWSNYINLRHLREQNQNLQAENDRLRLEQASLAEDARAGQRLREMLDFRGRYIDKTVPAQVVGTSGTDTARVIYINKGSKDGLQVQMPVITPDGIIGKVKNVFPGTAQVLLISDQTSGTGVVLQSTRIRGVMKGNASGQPQMINISPDERIQPGEPVVTSGGDQVYPPGMPVGVVDHVVADPDTSYVNVVIKPNADLSRLEEVLIVTAFSEKMPFAQEKDIQESEINAEQLKQRAADILSEKLPSIRDAKPAADTGTGSEEESEATAGGGDPARPMRPPSVLHPDRYSPGAAPPAESLTPGAAPPGLHRETSADATAPVVSKAPKPATAGPETDAGDAARVVAPTNRFPPKTPSTTATTASGTVAPGTTSPGSAVVKSGASGTTTTGSTAAKTTSIGATAAATPGAGPATTRAAAGLGTAASTPKPVVKPASGAGGSVTTTSGAEAGQTRPSSTGQTSSASTGQQTTPVVKRPAVSSETSDDILTPAGMGTIGTTPRPGATSKPATPKLATPAATGSPSPKTPSSQPAAAPPGGV